MSEKQQAPAYVQIVKDTAHVVAPKALEITKIFYPKMFSNNPEVYKYFNKTNQRTERQATALADAVIAYAINIDNLGALVDAVKVMAHKHCALGVQAEDYAIVHKNLMEAVGEVLKVDGEIANGWSESVLALASILIQTEKDLYTAAETRPGGWRGIRMFLVDEVVTEAKDVVSVYFKPKDGGESPEFTAGQYITLVENPSKDKHFAPRHYTISCRPSDVVHRLRITVKRLRAHSPDYEDGIMSSFVNSLKSGDEVALHPPFGVAAIPYSPAPAGKEGAAAEEGVVVFLTAGIGITTSIPLSSVEIESGRRQVVFVHADRDPASHALAREVAGTGRRCLFAYSAAGVSEDPAAHGLPPTVTVAAGARLAPRRAADFIADAAPAAAAAGRVDYWVCGPPGFTTAMVHGLCVGCGVPRARVHHEEFGPAMAVCPAGHKA